MDLASVVAALASVGVRVTGSTPNNNIQGDSSRACPTGLAGPEPSGTHNDPGQHFHGCIAYNKSIRGGVFRTGRTQCGHSARIAPIILLFILKKPLKTTNLHKRA